MTFIVLDLAGLIAVADLKPPTHRRSLVLMKQVLESWGQPELYEKALNVFGCADMSRTQVESYLRDCATAFDRAVAVTRTPIPFGFKLHAYVRPYVVEGAREMINEGCHREAMLWILAFFSISNTAIQIDAPEEEKPQYQATSKQLLFDMGLSSPHDAA